MAPVLRGTSTGTFKTSPPRGRPRRTDVIRGGTRGLPACNEIAGGRKAELSHRRRNNLCPLKTASLELSYCVWASSLRGTFRLAWPPRSDAARVRQQERIRALPYQNPL